MSRTMSCGGGARAGRDEAESEADVVRLDSHRDSHQFARRRAHRIAGRSQRLPCLEKVLGALKPGKQAVARLPDCQVDLHGSFDDGQTMEATGVDVCAQRRKPLRQDRPHKP